MNTQEYVSYFREIAEKLKDIGHTAENKKFTRINIEEVLNGLRSDLDMSTPVMVLENYEASFNDNRSDNVFKDLNGALMVLQNVDHGDYEGEAEAMDRCESAIMKIIAKMKEDRDYRQIIPLRGFELNSVRLYKVGGVFDNSYGYRMEFMLRGAVPLVVEPNDWNP